MLLEGIDEEEALEHIAATAREVAHADTAALALPGLGGRLLIELADGHDADKLMGTVMPEGGRAWRGSRGCAKKAPQFSVSGPPAPSTAMVHKDTESLADRKRTGMAIGLAFSDVRSESSSGPDGSSRASQTPRS